MGTGIADEVQVADPPLDGAARYWLRAAVRCALFSGFIAVLLTVVEPGWDSFVEKLVYSECIGLCIFGWNLLLAPALASKAGHPLVSRFLLRLVSVPVGLFAGLNLAAFVRGNPTGFAVWNRAAIFALPITVVASIGMMYFLWSRKRIADASAANELAQRHVAETRLKLLQAQIEPHMLFNTLANLRTLVEVDPSRAQTMLDQLIVYLRGTLTASRSTTTTLEHEFAHVEAYLELMRVRMASRLSIEIDLPGPLRTSPMPPMLLQPLVENAIKHGLEPKIEGGTVRIAASTVDGRLRVQVVDDGIGLVEAPAAHMDARLGADTGGYGLAHVRERLQTLYGDAAWLAIESQPGGGVRAVVELPL